MMTKLIISTITVLCSSLALGDTEPTSIEDNSVAEKIMSGNPVIEGWYADPEAIIYGKTYWIYPTTSDEYDKQTFFNAFSSQDLVT